MEVLKTRKGDMTFNENDFKLIRENITKYNELFRHCLTYNIEIEYIEKCISNFHVRNAQGVCNVNVHISFRVIGSSISNLEVAHEWLGLAFILDRLTKFDKNITYVRDGGITFSLAIKSTDWELFIKELKLLREWNDFGTFSN